MMPPLFAFGVLLAQKVTAPLPENPGLVSIAPVDSTEAAVNAVIGVFVKALFGISATVAVAGVMYGGFLMIRGGENIGKGKKAVAFALGGLIVMAMAYTVVQLVIGVDPASPDLGITR